MVMAGRKDKNTVDYFPHYCAPGKTIFILENQFGHLGYYVWFKTLELLGSNENHFIDLRNDTDLLFLISKMKITEQQLDDIYNLLAKLDAIDFEMWNEKIIYSENFVKNVADVYKRRNKNVYNKTYLCEHILNLCIHKKKKNNQQSTKESKAEESRIKESKISDEIKNFTASLSKLFPVDITSKLKDNEKWNWIDTIDKLVRIDKFTNKEIEKAVKSGRNSEFWNKQFLSLTKLRKKNKDDIKYINVFLNLNGQVKNTNTLPLLPNNTL